LEFIAVAYKIVFLDLRILRLCTKASSIPKKWVWKAFTKF